MKSKAIKLLEKLVSIQSLSRNEAGVADFLVNHLSTKGFKVKRVKNNIYFTVGKGEKTLLLNSHIDTVPPGDNWSIPPYKPQHRDDRLYGLGSTDAYASIVSMLTAIESIDTRRIKGRVIFAATAEEEISGNNGAELLFSEWGEAIDSAIIGEPTSGNICIAMKGLSYIILDINGKTSHASIPKEGDNAIQKASMLIGEISNIHLPEHPSLGKPSISVTMIEGGSKNNMIPDTCKVTFDVRTTPSSDRRYFISEINKIIKANDKYKGTVIHDRQERLTPKHTDEHSEIVTSALESTENCKVKPFNAMCDATFLSCPFIIFGPGKLEMAHAPDEYIEVQELEKFSRYYQSIILNYLK